MADVITVLAVIAVCVVLLALAACRAALKAWAKAWLFEVPEHVTRPAKVVPLFDEDVRREKRRLLSEANRAGDEATVKRLTRELTQR